MHNGRLVVDEPTVLPEGTVLDLVVDDEGDALDATDRRALDEAISSAVRSIAEGRGRLAADVLGDLRNR